MIIVILSNSSAICNLAATDWNWNGDGDVDMRYSAVLQHAHRCGFD